MGVARATEINDFNGRAAPLLQKNIFLKEKVVRGKLSIRTAGIAGYLLAMRLRGRLGSTCNTPHSSACCGCVLCWPPPTSRTLSLPVWDRSGWYFPYTAVAGIALKSVQTAGWGSDWNPGNCSSWSVRRDSDCKREEQWALSLDTHLFLPVRNGLSNPRGIDVELEDSSIFGTESRGSTSSTSFRRAISHWAVPLAY